MIREHDSVVLTADIAEHGLCEGDIGTVVMVHRSEAGYEVEFMTLLLASQVRPIGTKEIAHVRALGAV